jgi:glutamate transport system substrate-binding protein
MAALRPAPLRPAPLRRALVLVVLLGSVLATLTGCAGGSQGPNPQPAPVPGAAPRDRLTIGISFDQPGLGFKDGESYTGFDVETAKYVAKALGVPDTGITWVQADPGNRESLLTSGQADLVFSTYTITESRKQVIDFAGPYFLAHQDLLVRRNETEITGPDTLDGKDLCSVPGTTSAENVLKFYRGRIQLKEFPRFSDCVQALNNSEVDAVTTDDVILAGYAAQPQYRGRLKVIGQGFSDENYGVGIKKGDTALVDQVNTALKQYVADGSWAAALRITVAPSGYNLPSPPTPGSV